MLPTADSNVMSNLQTAYSDSLDQEGAVRTIGIAASTAAGLLHVKKNPQLLNPG